jgi:SAM-dependent methyltransferase
MKTKERFIEHYKNGYMPWAHNEVDYNLVEIVELYPIEPCKTLEIGCGTGTDAIWLAEQEFDVTACDASEIAIGLAKEKLGKKEVKCTFQVLDFMAEDNENKPFSLVFDRGFFHSFDSEKKRKKFAKRVAANLSDDGLWLTLVGSKDRPKTETGPPRRSALDIIAAAEPYFKILSLNASYFGNEGHEPAANWVCLMQKR